MPVPSTRKGRGLSLEQYLNTTISQEQNLYSGPPPVLLTFQASDENGTTVGERTDGKHGHKLRTKRKGMDVGLTV